VFTSPADRLEIEVDLVADLTVINPFDFFVEEYAEKYPFVYAPALAKELIPFLETAPLGPRLAAWLDDFRRTIQPGENTAMLLVRLNQLLQNQVKYLVRMEPGVQTPEQTLANCSGSCRDSGWLLVQIMRHLGVAARFASGYLIQLVADVKSLDGPSGTDRDFTDLHAWAEAFIPGAGWIGLDPTSGLLAGEGHIPLACTADPGNAAPVIGYTDVTNVEFGFAMSITRVHEDPRVTRPFSESQWQAIDALGEHVDQDLLAHDVRLTQGGEPTSCRWTTWRGPSGTTPRCPRERRARRGCLLKRLRARLRASGFVHFGQGKRYPGVTACPLGAGTHLAYRRRAAVGSTDDLIADTTKPGTTTLAVAKAFASDWPKCWACGFAADYRVRRRAASYRLGSRAAGQCRPDAGRPHGPRRASTPRAHPALRSRRPRGIRAAAARHRSAEWRGDMAVEPVAAAARASLRGFG
jgi:transglutaminase-like putative cysteine protease